MDKIIVYADQGVDGESLKHLILSLREIVDPSHHVLQRVRAKAIIEDPWEKETSLLIVPGGRDVFYHSLLNGKGTDKIRSFIEKGGKYLGICAGAYFACKKIEFEKGGPLEVCAPRSLQLFPGSATGPAYGLNKYSYGSLQGTEAAKISWNHGDCHVYFNGGCTFAAEESFPHVKPLSFYLDLPGRPPAILEIEIGKGLALLSGVHFEYSIKSLKEDPHLSRLYPLLLESEKRRRALFCEVMQRLGIHCLLT
ncbi:MAG: BPL-N domain-containing protein [Rhabdochlamydiaceae bacterium]